MADEADIAGVRVDEMEADAVAHIRRKASAIPLGEPGDCDGCGDYFIRTVAGLCGYCRDRRARPC